ncbi:MAG: hypothetical protein ABI042_19605 [Verrucomicrobiota bacterium]
MNREKTLCRRIKLLTWFFIVGLIISGLTAIPLEWEMNLVLKIFGASHLTPDQATSDFVKWLLKVREALHETNSKFPFIAYGFDWLAFGHIVIALVFIGALRDPVRNVWLFEFGMIACVLVIPWAIFFGGVRGIPFGWRLIDCSFGVFGFVPLWFCKRWTKELASLKVA